VIEEDNTTPLALAVENGHADTARLLITHKGIKKTPPDKGKKEKKKART
jgi:hypothetical protein